jgi:hypothetical protein
VETAIKSSRPFDTAVLFLIFNRPDTTRTVFQAIRQARPPRLYVAADGPRQDRFEEAKCQEAREVASAVDWPCELKTLFRPTNHGCRMAVSEAITWFFDHETEGIILEDDCLPVPSFFPYCQALLEAFRHDDRFGQIAGTCFFEADAPVDRTASVLYSRYGPIWGWATWRRAWQCYDADLTNWPMMTQPKWLLSAYPHKRERAARLRIGQRLVNKALDTWDYQWAFAKSYHSLLSVIPRVNLVVNIGFGVDATHTTFADSKAPTEARDIGFPLALPAFVLPDGQYDTVYASRAFPGFIRSKVASIVARVRGALRRYNRNGL